MYIMLPETSCEFLFNQKVVKGFQCPSPGRRHFLGSRLFLYIMYTPPSVGGCRRQGDHLTNYSHSILQVGRSDSQDFKNISLSYLLSLLHREQTFSGAIRRNVLQMHPSPYFRQCCSSSTGVFHTHHNGTCSFYLRFGGQPKSFLALFDLMPETRYLTPTWKKFPSELQDRRGIGKEQENAVQTHPTSQLQLTNPCKLLDPVQIPQTCYCKAFINLNNSASFCTFKPYPKTLSSIN